MLHDDEFVKLLQWKLSQNLLFCMCDYEDDIAFMTGQTLVAPVWDEISQRLQELYDPILQQKYNALNLDVDYWSRSRAPNVVMALFGLKHKFKGLIQLLSESNRSLNVVTHFQMESQRHEQVDDSHITIEMIGNDRARVRDERQPTERSDKDGFVWVSTDYFDERTTDKS